MNPRAARLPVVPACRLTYWRMLRWALAVMLAALLLLDLGFPLPLPDIRDRGTVVVAADGTPLRAFAGADGIWRTPVTPADVSPLYLEALIGYEDRRFWHHPGINPWALLRAGMQWAREGRIVSGGSTLTMQVARILDRHPRTLWGKLNQLLRALQLEAHLSKREILQLYLEYAPFGGTIEGVEAASWAYLGKSASQLSHAEAALLAVLPQAPSRWRPDRHPEAARRARDKVLARMQERGLWSAETVQEARMEPVVARSLHIPMHAALLAQRLRQQSGTTARITTTLDSNLQRMLEARVATYFSRLPARTSAALLVMDNATLEARAYIGSLLFADSARLGHVDMVQAWRSPGSTLKPFLYAMALDEGLIHSESLLVDAPQDFGGYRPGNFDAAFNGPVSAATALRRSLNIPAVDLLERIGPVRFAARLEHGGIHLRFPRGSAPNLALILGGTGVRLDELVGAYAAFHRNGIAGRVRYTPDTPLLERRLMSPGAAWIVREILAAHPRPGDREGMFDLRQRLQVAWKTGTSYGYRDAWAIGGTREHTVGVWVGRPDGTPLPGQYGAVTALPLLFEVMDSLSRAPGASIPPVRPESVQEHEICWPLGFALERTPPALCQRKLTAMVLDGQFPPTFADRAARHWQPGRIQFAIDADSGQRVSAACAGHPKRQAREIVRWPVLAAPWLTAAQQHAQALPTLAADCPPDGLDNTGVLHIDGLNDRATLIRAPGALHPPRLELRALGSQMPVDWLLNGRRIAQTQGAGVLRHEFPDPGEYTLTALAGDGAWASVNFKVANLAP